MQPTTFKLGIVITVDPINKGRIPSEAYYFNALYNLQKTLIGNFSIDIICLSKRGVAIVEKLSTPTLDETDCRFFDFPHNVVLLSNDEEIEDAAKTYDVLLCQKTYAMPFGGKLAERCIKQYKLMSLFTGKYNKPIIFRISDCEEDYVDYSTQPLRLIELGIGSGCLIISILNEFKLWNAIGIDISRKALNLAKKNCQKFNLS
jgi:hypothetical protein